MTDLASQLTAVTATFLLAGLVKGVAGLGLPTVGVGLLSLLMPPVEAAALVIVPSLATNVWQMFAGPALGPLSRRLWPMMAGICLGTWSGAALFAGAGAAAATVALGGALALYAAIGLSPLRLPRIAPRAERWLGPAAGAVTGLVTAVTGVFVIPAVPYLQCLDLDRDRLVQAMGLSFTVSTVALAVALAGAGPLLEAGLAGGSFLALAPALAGMLAGARLRRAVRPALFRRLFFLGLLLLGAHLAARGIF